MIRSLAYFFGFFATCIVSFAQVGRIDLYQADPVNNLDLSERRPIVDLTGMPITSFYHLAPGERLYANFYHQGRFWLAVVPANGVEKIYAMQSVFAPGAAHIFLRFSMKQPLRLIAEVNTQAQFDQGIYPPLRTTPIEISEISVSSEAQWKIGDPHKKFNLKRGMLSAFWRITRVTSLEERFRNYYMTGNDTLMKSLDPPNHGPNEIFRSALEFSEKQGIATPYNTVFRNCDSALLRILSGSRCQLSADRLLILSSVIPVLTFVYGLTLRGFRPGPKERMMDDPTLADLARSAWQHLPAQQFLRAQFSAQKKFWMVYELVKKGIIADAGFCQLFLQRFETEKDSLDLGLKETGIL